MTGSIRVFGSLLVLMGVAGGLDYAPDMDLIPLIVIAIVACLVGYSGIVAMKESS